MHLPYRSILYTLITSRPKRPGRARRPPIQSILLPWRAVVSDRAVLAVLLDTSYVWTGPGLRAFIEPLGACKRGASISPGMAGERPPSASALPSIRGSSVRHVAPRGARTNLDTCHSGGRRSQERHLKPQGFAWEGTGCTGKKRPAESSKSSVRRGASSIIQVIRTKDRRGGGGNWRPRGLWMTPPR